MKINCCLNHIEPNSTSDEFVIELKAVLTKEQLAELIKKSTSGFVDLELQ